MKISVVTIFPELFVPFTKVGVLGRAVAKKIVQLDSYNPRDWASPPHYQVDDSPYGGGPGMVMRPEPLALCLDAVMASYPKRPPVILLTPTGDRFKQSSACSLAQQGGLILLCGRYEGIDQRIIDEYVTASFTIGNYILTGGEVAAMVIIEATTRLIPGVLGNQISREDESIGSDDSYHGEAPLYTKPRVFREQEVPEVLLSGDHERIAAWRKKKATSE